MNAPRKPFVIALIAVVLFFSFGKEALNSLIASTDMHKAQQGEVEQAFDISK